MTQLELPKWYDLHAHFRQEELMAPLIRDHLTMGCAGILAMPNTKPPVAKVFKSDSQDCWSIEEYMEMLGKAGGDGFADMIVPLYLTAETSPSMIEAGAKAGILRACKYYPPHGTTGAEFGQAFGEYIKNGVFRAMEEAGIVLCVHGEEHGMKPEAYFACNMNAEEVFYSERMPEVAEKFPQLKIVAEHVTTKTAVDFVSSASGLVGATVTPQHLLYTVGHLLKGLNYHLYCLPLLKFEEDREALRRAVTAPNNTKFFAGTDSAPHAKKVTECGCAAGCYSGGIAPQLYAEAFEMAGCDLSGKESQEAFKRFLCLNGPNFYGLDIPAETFTIEKSVQTLGPLETEKGAITRLSQKLLWRIV